MKKSGVEQAFEDLGQTLRFEGTAHPIEDVRAFGARALKIRGRIFTMLWAEALVVKLPQSRVDALVQAGEGSRFGAGQGRA